MNFRSIVFVIFLAIHLDILFWVRKILHTNFYLNMVNLYLLQNSILAISLSFNAIWHGTTYLNIRNERENEVDENFGAKWQIVQQPAMITWNTDITWCSVTSFLIRKRDRKCNNDNMRKRRKFLYTACEMPFSSLSLHCF